MPEKVTLYKIETGESVDLYAVDARDALLNHHDEWTDKPVKEPRAAKKSGEDVQSTPVVTERAGPTRRDGPETMEAQSNADAPAPVENPAEELGEDQPAVTSADLDGYDDKQLRAYIKKRTGKAPAGFTKRDKLLEKAKAL